MEERIRDLYYLPDIDQYEDFDLLTLRETCAATEERVYALIETLSGEDRDLLLAYIDLRNELEFESVKTALRWAKSKAERNKR